MEQVPKEHQERLHRRENVTWAFVDVEEWWRMWENVDECGEVVHLVDQVAPGKRA